MTIDPDVNEKVLASAARDGVSISAWMTTAAREALKRRVGLASVDLSEKQRGHFRFHCLPHWLPDYFGPDFGKAKAT